ncbi:hypothetical protein OKW41_004491 [Paraburkholderia sp. UCT70]
MLQRVEEPPDDATSRTDRPRDAPSELELRHELTRCAACCLRLSAAHCSRPVRHSASSSDPSDRQLHPPARRRFLIRIGVCATEKPSLAKIRESVIISDFRRWLQMHRRFDSIIPNQDSTDHERKAASDHHYRYIAWHWRRIDASILKPGNRLICVSRSRNLDLEATAAASGRLGTGLLFDRIHAGAVVFVFFVAGAAGVFLLHSARDYRELLLAATLVGLTIGAEGDLISYQVRSHFGLRAFGTLYGIAFSGYRLGAVIGPVGLSACLDRHGSYDLPLHVISVLLLTASALTLTLGRYRRSGPLDGATPSSLGGA